MWFRQMPLIDLVQLSPHPQNLLCMDCNITRLTKITSARLVNHNARVRQAETFPISTATKKQGAHRGRLADTSSGYGRRDIGHRVIDRKTSGDRATGRVDVEIYGFLRRIGFEEE